MYGEFRDRGERAEETIRREGLSVRKYELELYEVGTGQKSVEKCSKNVARAYEIYKKEGSLERHIRRIEKKYIREMEREQRGVERGEWRKYYMLRTKEKIRWGGVYGVMYIRHERGAVVLTNEARKGSRYYEKPRRGSYDEKMYEICEVELEIRRVR